MVMSPTVTYDDGNRLEDVLKMVINVAPYDTPFWSSTGKTKAIQVIHQWPEDTLNTYNANTTQEGGTITMGTVTAPARVTNITQIFSKVYGVSSSDIAAKGAGVDDMFLYQQSKMLKEIATDIENTLLNGTLSTGYGTGTGSAIRQLAGALQFITTNATVNATAVLGETAFNGLMEMVWKSGGYPDKVYTGSHVKREIDTFYNSTTKFVNAEDKVMYNVINVYEGAFSRYEVALSRALPNTSPTCAILVVENSRMKTAILEPIHDLSPEEVAQTIHGKIGVIRGELTLEARAQKTASALTYIA